MSLTKLTNDVNIIQALVDEPNDIGGLTAEQLKAKFDQAAGLIKTYLNSTMTTEIDGMFNDMKGTNGAKNIGTTPIISLSGNNVQDVLESVKSRFDNIGTTNTNVELSNAHFASNGNTYNSIGTRFDDIDAALIEKVNKTDKIISSQIASVNQTEAEKLQLENMSQSVIQAIAGSGVTISPILGANTVGKPHLASDSVDETKINFMKVLSNNLVNKNTMVVGGYYGGDGLWVTNASYQSTDFIEVEVGQSYTRFGTFTATFWKADSTFLSAVNTANFTVPANARYVRIAFAVTNTTPYLYKGTAIKTYDEYKIGSDLLKMLPSNMDMVYATTENLFNKDTITATGGYLDGSGNFVAHVEYCVSDFIPVDEWAYYCQGTASFVNFYDINKIRINYSLGSGGSAGAFMVPTGLGIKHIKINTKIANLETEMLVKDNVYPSAYIPYYKIDLDYTKYKLYSYAKSKLYNKKLNAYGDSITARGFGYHSIIKNNIGNMTVRNYGLSGRSLASRGTTTDATYPPAVTDYVNMDNDADIISIFLGTNDFGSQVPLGNINSTNITEFYGALNVLALGLIEKYPGKKICFITPMQRNVSGDDTKAIPLTSYVNAMKEVGSKFGIPVLDLYSYCGLYPKSNAINTTYFESADGLHPNLNGHKVFAPRIQAFYESL